MESKITVWLSVGPSGYVSTQTFPPSGVVQDQEVFGPYVLTFDLPASVEAAVKERGVKVKSVTSPPEIPARARAK